MPYVPAWCPRCGLTFESSLFIGDGASQIFIQDGQENCPRCGAWARVLDGEWAAAGGILSMMSGPAWSRQRLQSLLDRLAASRTAEAAWNIAAREAPEVAAAVERAVDKRQPQGMTTKEQRFWALLATLLAVLQMALGSASAERPLTPEQIDYIVGRTMQGYRGHQDVPAEAPPTTPPSSTPPASDDEPGHQLPPET